MAWNPHVTVAALAVRDGRFLLVEEETDDGLRLNQPAGHLEAGESLMAACTREALEETAYHFAPAHLIGVYHWTKPGVDLTYVRFAFAGEVTGFAEARVLDTGIVRALWLTPEEVLAEQARHRSPLVWQCIQDYLDGRRYPLDVIRHFV